MKAKSKTWTFAVLVVSAIALTGNYSNIINIHVSPPTLSESVTYDPVPPSFLLEREPDQIVTENGRYVKTLQSDRNIDLDNVVYDVTETTAETEAINEYGYTYVKAEDSQ